MKLKKLVLCFENEDTISISVAYIKNFLISNVQQHGNRTYVFNQEHKIDCEDYYDCNYMSLEVDYEKLNQFRSNQTGEFDADRINKHHDIVHIDLYFENDKVERIYLPWENRETTNGVENVLQINEISINEAVSQSSYFDKIPEDMKENVLASEKDDPFLNHKLLSVNVQGR